MKFTQENGEMPTLQALSQAFKKARLQGAVVGGRFLDDLENFGQSRDFQVAPKARHET